MPVKIKGIENVIKNLERLKVNIPNALAKAGTFSMQNNIEGPAKQLCPVDTGNLRASIHTVASVSGNGALIQTGTNVFYGPYIEFGTGIYALNGAGRKTPWRYEYAGHKGSPGVRFTHGNMPQPFLTPAYTENQDKIMDDVELSLNNQLETLTKGGK